MSETLRVYQVLTPIPAYTEVNEDGTLTGHADLIPQGGQVTVLRTIRWDSALVQYQEGDVTLYGWAFLDEIQEVRPHVDAREV